MTRSMAQTTSRPSEQGIRRRIRCGARPMLAGLLVAGSLAARAGQAEPPRPAEGPGPAIAHAFDDRWRARGMAFVDLPLGLRARYEAQALHRLGARGELEAPFVELTEGASRRSARLLESRFALTRAVAAHVELELAWSARSPLSMVDLLRVEDQRLAALIRFVP